MINVVLPFHLRTLSRIQGELRLSVPEPFTLGAVIDTLEASYPMLRGTIRDIQTKERRPFIRFFACGEDFSNAGWELQLPEAVIAGKQPLRIVGAMAGG
jgi:hypothetical protein